MAGQDAAAKMGFMDKNGVISGAVRLVAYPLPEALIVIQRINNRIRGAVARLRIMAIGGQVGKRLSIGPGVRLAAARGASVHVGDRVSLSGGAVLRVGKSATISIGNDVHIGDYTVVSAERSVHIGDRAQIAEHCSVRDHNHDTSAPSMQKAPAIHGSVRIGVDSWIGRGVAVLMGADVGAGAVVGANAVVLGVIPQQAIAVGVPGPGSSVPALARGDEVSGRVT